MIKKLLFIWMFLIAFSCSSSIDRRMIDSDKLSELISQKEKTLVYVWTTWCSGCRKTLTETLPKIYEDLDSSRYQILLIAASRNKNEVDSLVTTNVLKKNSYLLDFMGPDKGTFQNFGIQFLLRETFPGEKIFTRSIPVFFLVDCNKNVLHKKIPHSYNEAIKVLGEHVKRTKQ